MERNIHTAIIGAGPAGLAAAYTLAKAGISTVVIEKGGSVGGLMQSISRGDFVVDVGRKELYTRISKVNALWEELLGDDYIAYPHREGILYQKHVIETSRIWRGMLRGVPLKYLLACTIDYALSYFKYGFSTPANYMEYWYRRRGMKLSQILSQGYEEKFSGVKWRDTPSPSHARVVSDKATSNSDLVSHAHQQEREKPTWRHPSRGTGQICEALAAQIRKLHGDILLSTNIIAVRQEGERITAIEVEVEGTIIIYRPMHVISSIPVQGLATMLLPANSTFTFHAPVPTIARTKRSTICLYLFFNEAPRFPHVWLKVTCPQMQAGRITNYAAFNGRMVPQGKTALCVEFFCVDDDPLLGMSDEQLRDLGLMECAAAGLIDASTCFDNFVLRLPGANAATSWRDWMGDALRDIRLALGSVSNLYDVNRPGTDKATYAGIEAANAILTGDKSIYEREKALTLHVDQPVPD